MSALQNNTTFRFSPLVCGLFALLCISGTMVDFCLANKTQTLFSVLASFLLTVAFCIYTHCAVENNDLFFYYHQAKDAAIKRYSITLQNNISHTNNSNEVIENTNNLRLALTDMFLEKFSLNCVSYRVADELPHLLCSLGDKGKLSQCLSSPLVLMHLFRRGRSNAVLGYWNTLSKDMASIKEVRFFF